MPELPEVETIRRQLLSCYSQEAIKTATLKTASLLQNVTVKEYEERLRDQRLSNISRRGKYLIFCLDNNFAVFHLGMSGIFLKEKSRSKYPQHVHLEIHFASGKKLFYQDVRKFGKLWLYNEYPEFPRMGMDPFETGTNIQMHLDHLISSRHMNIKNFLMNQAFIAGIGNIYASEILFLCGISPLRNTSSILPTEKIALYEAIYTILETAIDRFGTTYSAYQTVSGESGSNQDFLKVYQRDGQSCVSCGQEITKIVIGGRSTFYCRKCQR